MTPDPKPDHLPPLADAQRVLHQLASTALGMLRANVPPIHKSGPPMLADLLNQAAWEQLSSVRSAVLCYDAELARLRGLLREAHELLTLSGPRCRAEGMDHQTKKLNLLRRIQEATQ